MFHHGITKTWLPVTLFFFLISYTLISGCNDVCSCKKVSCPAFSDPNFDAWFPYNSGGQQLVLKNAAGDTDTMTISSPGRSASYEANKGCYNGATGCSAQAYIQSNELINGQFKFSVNYRSSVNWDATQSNKTVLLQLYTLTVNAQNVLDTGLSALSNPIAIQSHFYSNINLNGVNYQQVQLLQADTSNGFQNPGVYKIYIAKNTGLIAYEEYPSQSLWTKE